MTFNIKYLFIFLLFIVSCSNETATETHEQDHEEEETPGQLHLSDMQVKQAGIALGTFDYKPLGQSVKANGTIELPPNNLASITPLMDGFVQSIHYLEGAEVKKGQILATLRNPEYIMLQQEYVQAVNNLQVLEQELDRQQTLNEAQVGAKKKLQQTEANHNNAKAQKAALAERLKYLGINPERVAAGHIQNKIYLTAPFDGTVTSVKTHNGQHIEAGEMIMELINREHMHLELKLFQKDIPKVKEGQKILFKVPAFENNKLYDGEVSLVGKNMDTDAKTIRVHGHFHEEFDLIAGLYVEANILQDTSMVRALPDDAIIRDDGKYYFFRQIKTEGNELTFTKTEFVPGSSSSGFTEIKSYEPELDSSKIVTKGAFYLKSEMNKGEGGHHH